jgi:hypothetical protein
LTAFGRHRQISTKLIGILSARIWQKFSDFDHTSQISASLARI